jgi:AAA family ATP:ADP antiporter
MAIMTSLLGRLFGRVVTLQQGEAATAPLMFAYSFLAMTAYNIVQPITRSKFISSLGADNLPYVELAAGVLIAVLMHLYVMTVARLPRSWVISATQAGEAALLVLFWILFKTGASWVSVAFFVLGRILGILLISQFWTLANDLYDARQAKRVFGFIGGGSVLGGATGNAISAFMVQEVGSDNLLLVSAATLTVCLVLVMAIVRRHPFKAGAGAATGEQGVGSSEAIQLLRSSKHLQLIAAVIAFAAIGAAIINQQLNMAVAAIKGAGSTDEITAFLAQVGFYMSMAGFIVQVGLTSRIHHVLGLGFALLILPVSLGTTATIMLFNAALWAPAVARGLDSGLRYTVDKTTREVLFLPLPVNLKYRAKPFIDVTVDRFAKAFAALLLLVLIKPWGLGLDWQRLSYASLAVTAVWIFVALRARAEYLKTFRRGIETRAIVPGNVRPDVSDAATIELLVEELSDADDTRVLYAIEMLETLDKRNLVTPLLLHHESAKVRARALAALETARPSVAARWKPAVERMLKDSDADVRAAAVRALAVLSTEDASTVMRRYLDDPEPRVAATAAAVLANSRVEADWDAAEAAFSRLTQDTREIAAGARREVAASLARVTNQRFRPLLVLLVGDGDVEVARQAIRSVQAMGAFDPLFVPALVALLGHRVLKPVAREVLVGFGDDVLDALAYFLNDADENIWVRRHIPATLALFPTERSMRILLEALGDADGFLRYKVVTALEKLRRDHPHLAVPRSAIEALAVEESFSYDDHLTARYDIIQRDGEASSSLLVRALDDKLERTLDRIYRLLGLVYPWKDIAAARHAIEAGDRRMRAGALEYLDNLLKGSVRARIMPILEDCTMEEKARRASIVLRSRSRGLEGTLAHLVHDEDQVVAAAAIHFVVQRRLWSLGGDLESERTHRSANDWYVFEAASWALAAHQLSENPRRDRWMKPLPVVELADRLRKIPLFDFVSVNELFRIAGTARQVRYEPGRDLYHEGFRPDDVHFLLDGAVQVSGGSAPAHELQAPAALAFEEILQGSPLGVTISAADRVICLALGRGEFLTMLSDNIVLAQGLFRMLLDTPNAQQWRTVYVPPQVAVAESRSAPLQPLDKVLLLRQNPLLARATVSQLLDLAGITREVALTAGSVIFTSSDKAVLYHLLEGEVRLDADGRDPILAGPGCTIGVAEILAGVPVGRRATVTRAGQALRLEHEELFEVLADHIDLLQSLFSGLLTASRPEARKDTGLAEDTGVIAV